MLVTVLGIAISAILFTESQIQAEANDLSPIAHNPTEFREVISSSTPTTMVITTPTPQKTSTIEELPAKEIAYVERVIDGDSIEVMLNRELVGLRYIGLDAPEIGMPFSIEASKFNQDMVEGQIVLLERDTTNKDRYGRLLRYVYLQDGTLVNDQLVKLGFARALAYPPDVKYQELFNSSEEEAMESGIGLWAKPTPTTIVDEQDQSPQILVEPSCSQFNSPGNDNENKNEEYVCLANVGSNSADLSGWSIQDQYGWTYQFPTFSLSANSFVKIRTGCGTDSQQDLYWCKDETAVWNNDGDCVFLMNPESQLVAEYCY
ncbi:MAG: thermonuclease family protein [Chloroflexota bacterium]|nr:MAG: thermonuclease family protein [Chloroflexota bacterium]